MKFLNNKSLIMTALLVFVALVGISAISATDIDSDVGLDSNNTIHPFYPHHIPQDYNTQDHKWNIDEWPKNDDNFVMSVPSNTASTGNQWKVSPDSYGVELVDHYTIIDHPGLYGSGGTDYFVFHKTADEYCAKLILVSPSGNIIDEKVIGCADS